VYTWENKRGERVLLIISCEVPRFVPNWGGEARKCAYELTFTLMFKRVFIVHPRIFRVEEFFNKYF
jgi:hypothetical protein